ncbi:MAG: glycosyltransferase, partial [Arenicellales bacterium]
PLESVVRRRIEERNLESRVRLTGFVNQTEMPRVLWAGDILAMCSEKDPHPLAVSEAMSVGNAIVASDRVGCVGATDAARPGRNALVYRCGDVTGLSARLRCLAADPALLVGMRKESLDLTATQDVAVAARAVAEFLRTALEAP